MDCRLPGFTCPMGFSRQERTGVGSHSLLQGFFLTQGSITQTIWIPTKIHTTMPNQNTAILHTSYKFMHACMLSPFSSAQFFMTLWTVTHLTLLSTRLSRQEYWSGLPFPPSGYLPNQGSNTCLLCLLYWQVGLFFFFFFFVPLALPGKPHMSLYFQYKSQFTLSIFVPVKVTGINKTHSPRVLQKCGPLWCWLTNLSLVVRNGLLTHQVATSQWIAWCAKGCSNNQSLIQESSLKN